MLRNPAEAPSPFERSRSTPRVASRLLTRVMESLGRTTERYRQRRALAELDERLLRDVGLDRRKAECELRKRFWEI